MTRPILPLAIGLSLGGFAPPEEPIVLDPQHPPRLVEGAYDFECPDVRASVRYRQERGDPASVARVEDGLRVTLLELTVSGSSLPADQLRSAGEAFGSLAWVSDINATCFPGGAGLSVRGMPKRAFGEAMRTDGPLPSPVVRSIRLTAPGAMN